MRKKQQTMITMNKNVKWIVLLLGSMFVMQVYAQKGKITSAQLSLQDGKVMDAKRDIDAALQDPDIQKMVKAWNTKGDVYKNIYESKVYYAQNPATLFDSKDAYMKAYELETNPKKQKDFSAPLAMVAGYLFNEGLDRFNNKRYDDAYKHFDASMQISDFLFAKGLAPALDTNVIYATAMSGANINKTAEIQPLLEKLISLKYDKLEVYEILAQVYSTQKNTAALATVVASGLEKYPTSKRLQEYDLDAAMNSTDVQAAIDKLEKTVAKDPTNSLSFFSLGLKYENAGKIDKAIENFKKALELNPKFEEAAYNVGVMYIKGDDELVKQINAENDEKKYDALKQKRNDIMKTALPYFETAYNLNPKNDDYRRSLKKIYAILNMLDKASLISDGYTTSNNNGSTNNSLKIKMEEKNNVNVVPVKINGLQEIGFIFDTGASETTVTADIVSVLLRQKVVSKQDFLPGKAYQLADGTIVNSSRFLIKKLEIGNFVFTNVEAGIVSANTEPLLGQNVLSKFKTVSQNNYEGFIILEK
jgi:tetratricopeptide (TPR) repeat protein